MVNITQGGEDLTLAQQTVAPTVLGADHIPMSSVRFESIPVTSHLPLSVYFT
jgi:hypothetical protein